MNTKYSLDDPSRLIEEVRHQNEKSRFALAIFAIAPLIILVIAAILGSFGLILVYFGILYFFLWFFGSLGSVDLWRSLFIQPTWAAISSQMPATPCWHNF